MPDGARLRRVRIVRDYGMFDRREAPQYYPEVSPVSRAAGGDADLAAVGALVADPGRCRILLALGDGRALPASRLADEAGVTPATASSHLRSSPRVACWPSRQMAATATTGSPVPASDG